MGGQPPVNVRRVGERHNIVRQTDSGFGVDARVGPGRFPREPTCLCLSGLFLMTFAMGGIPRASSGNFFFLSFKWRLITLQYCGGFCHAVI